jgi:hypothetical protein
MRGKFMSAVAQRQVKKIRRISAVEIGRGASGGNCVAPSGVSTTYRLLAEPKGQETA